MCGICGIYNYAEPNRPAEPALIKAMMQAMLSRGPDDEGTHIQGGLGLGFRRLSIVDLAGGQQPDQEQTRCGAEGLLEPAPPLSGAFESASCRHLPYNGSFICSPFAKASARENNNHLP